MKHVVLFFLGICCCAGLQAQMQTKLVKVVDQNVIFRLYAPLVSDVKVVCDQLHLMYGSDTIPLKRQNNGTWQDTFKIIPPGFYSYRFLINGALVHDYLSPVCFEKNTWMGGFDVPLKTDSFSIRKSGPFGSLEQHIYKSSVTNQYRKCLVYLPFDYDIQQAERYNTIYLFADWGENEDAWITQGRVNDVLDNAINSGVASPCLVVLENKNSLKSPDSASVNQLIANSILVNDLVPFIDRVYRTAESAASRMVAGCAEGSIFAANVAAENPTVFKSLGIYGLPDHFANEDEMVSKL
ncbi:MAG TPA: alpha/beta hydrolase-fold protein, partial [Prolixibacteraceae bacterium]|nr:alpha/beta hydrolase-fold protein [Prolixibacteraceae bacterium]